MLEKQKREIVKISKKIKELGFFPGFSGNISLKTGDKILITPSGLDKGELKTKDISVMDLNGNFISGAKPSSEYRMHLAIYNVRKDILAIVHSHPPAISALACLKLKKIEPILAEFVIYFKNNIPFIPYKSPGSENLARVVKKHIGNSNAIILKNHGLVTFARNPANAIALTEEAEHLARVYLIAKFHGSISHLKSYEIKKLKDLSSRLFL